MTNLTDELINEFFKTGTLRNLPQSHFIDGNFFAGDSSESIEISDPGTSKTFHSIRAGNDNDVNHAVASADKGLNLWKSVHPSDRGNILLKAASIIKNESERLAVIETLACGKPLSESFRDMKNVIKTLKYYAGAADKIQGDTFSMGQNYLGFTLAEPIGITAHIIPWNFPLSTAARGIAPALAAGCSVVAKPAETTPLTTLLFAEILSKAGLPDGTFNVVTGTGKKAGALLASHPDIRHITFTGSVSTGIAVMKMAASNITSVILELGGKSPFIVMQDADLPKAAEDITNAIFSNAGQICSAGSRLLVHRSIHSELVENVKKHAEKLKIGHGLRRPDLGPVNSATQLEKITNYVDQAKRQNRSILTGGNCIKDPISDSGWFFQPTIIDNVPQTDTISREEIFGPVLTVQVFGEEQEAVKIANDSEYGLVAGVYTNDFGCAHRMANKLDAGHIYLNKYFSGGIEVPFGGNKRSGFGREKGLIALKNYTRIKSVTGIIS